jgi:hypothetical protein
MIRYCIHDLASVEVDEAVARHVAEGIAFQIGHFRAGGEGPSGGPEARIRFLPYARYTGGGKVHFHSARAESGRSLHAPASRHAVERTPTGYDVYSDSGETFVNLLVEFAALRRGFTLVHAAGWVDGQGRATVLPGPGGVGKTALLCAAVERGAARALGDDLVLVGRDGIAKSFPRAVVLKPYHREQYPHLFPAGVSRWRRAAGPVLRFTQENIPFRGLIRSWARRAGRLEGMSVRLQQDFTGAEVYPIEAERLFGAAGIATTGRVTRVVYLERHAEGRFEIEPLGLEEAVARSLAVLQHEWVDFGRWFCQLGAVGVVSFPEYYRGVEGALRAGFGEASLVRARVPEAVGPDELGRWFERELGFAAEPAGADQR